MFKIIEDRANWIYICVPSTLNCLRGCDEMFSLISFNVHRAIWYHWCMFSLSSVGIDVLGDFYPNIQRNKNRTKQTQNIKKNLDTIIGNWMLLNTDTESKRGKQGMKTLF